MNINKKYVKLGAIILAVVAAVICAGFIGIKAFYDKLVIKDDRSALDQIPKFDRNESELERDINQNIAIFGVDKDGMRTDVIFVVNLNTETNAIKVIAVPRDTKVTWTEYQQEKMAELDKGYHDYSKITEMSAYGGLDNLRYFTINTLEDIMGITIDHYVVINIDAFRKIVDAVGGVEINVPRRMEYNDNYQDLHIDLQPGLQLLNGEQAEGLVRWRHNEDYSEQYAEGDVGRIETQQLFMKALAQKVLSTNSPIDLFKIAAAVYSDLKTDIQFTDLKTYLSCASQFNVNDITFATLPGEAVREDKWYYILNQPEVDAFMQKILYNREVPVIEAEEETQQAEEQADEASVENETSYQQDLSQSVRWKEDPSMEQEDTDERAIALPTQQPEVSEEAQEPAAETESPVVEEDTLSSAPVESDQVQDSVQAEDAMNQMKDELSEALDSPLGTDSAEPDQAQSLDETENEENINQ